MSVAVIGAGAFGTALACALTPCTLWAREGADTIAQARENIRRLPGVPLPDGVTVTGELSDVTADTLLLALPMQALRPFVLAHADMLAGRVLVACAKGVDLDTLQGPTGVLRAALPDARVAILTGPSFADDIARGLPTALTLACDDPDLGRALQARLSTPTLRLYRNPDVIGAELGGALKNVIAIAAGVVIGAGLGESARAALIARGYAEMQRLSLALGARAETLAGLSGLGDLVLTCGSSKSRNFRYGMALGAGREFDTSVTVEGVATARAVTRLATAKGIDMPLTAMVAALSNGTITLERARAALLARPLTDE
jgi:glycerol-3-phosphate dehydrogenase (NAD(P)+)